DTENWWTGSKDSAFEPQRSRLEPQFYLRSSVYMSLVDVKSDIESQTSSYWCGVETRKEGMPAQVPSSSSEHDSK
ncbi:hypothetical protein AVEN_211535-1, partial [Araneus ventricosus]